MDCLQVKKGGFTSKSGANAPRSDRECCDAALITIADLNAANPPQIGQRSYAATAWLGHWERRRRAMGHGLLPHRHGKAQRRRALRRTIAPAMRFRAGSTADQRPYAAFRSLERFNRPFGTVVHPSGNVFPNKDRNFRPISGKSFPVCCR